MMQRATHPSLQVRNAHEAHIIMEAVRLGHLPLISRRLSTKERSELVKAGAVFVWEESDYRGGVDRGGIERWTDGLKWSQSRMHEPFLLYEEKADVPKEEAEKSAGEKKVGDAASRARRQNRPNKLNGLTKQTYSALLRLPDGATGPAAPKPQKWHLTCYFRRPDHITLPTVDSDPVLRECRPAPETFQTAKGLTRRKSSAVSLDPTEDALARLHPGGNPGLSGSLISLAATVAVPGRPHSHQSQSQGESDTDTSGSPLVSPHPGSSPYDTRWGSPWSASSASASVTSSSPLTPPASYGIPTHPSQHQHSPTSPYPPQQHYGYHYSMHPAGVAVAHFAQPPNCTYHLQFPASSSSSTNTAASSPPSSASSPREGTTLPPIRQMPDITRHLPSHHTHAHAHGLGMGQQQHQGTVTYGEQFGTGGVTYDPSRGYYVERRWAEGVREE